MTPQIERPDFQGTFGDWIRRRVDAERYWFQRIELASGLVTPGWSDPAVEKLPHFGLPDDLTGMRVLDIGCAEGFFSFECERRGATDVVGIDSFPGSIRRFTICRDALGSSATAYLCSVYDLSPKTFGTFDLVLFFGVLYHLRHPLLALEKIASVCSGALLTQTATYEDAALGDTPVARYFPSGLPSGPDQTLFDPTVFWFPNNACLLGMLAATGFVDITLLSTEPTISVVAAATAPTVARGTRPDESKAPWS